MHKAVHFWSGASYSHDLMVGSIARDGNDQSLYWCWLCHSLHRRLYMCTVPLHELWRCTDKVTHCRMLMLKCLLGCHRFIFFIFSSSWLACIQVHFVSGSDTRLLHCFRLRSSHFCRAHLKLIIQVWSPNHAQVYTFLQKKNKKKTPSV